MKLVKKIGTHSGKFHADDVTAVMLLQNFLPEYQNAELVRTRDKAVLATMDIVVDVGGIYDHSTCRYDHHQIEFEETYSKDYDIRLSASGLVFKHYGIELIRNALSYLFDTDNNIAKFKADLDEKSLEEFKDKLYHGFFCCLDAVDNGVSKYPPEVEPRYSGNSTSLVHRIGNMNKSWWQEDSLSEDELFKQAMQLAKADYLNAVTKVFFNVFVVKNIVKEYLQNRLNVDKSGKIVFLERSIGWKRALLELEEELGIVGEILLVIFPNPSGGFRVQSMPETEGGFENRAPLVKEWRGLDEEKLREISGIKDIVFVHHSGFIGGAKTFESALKMARVTLESLN